MKFKVPALLKKLLPVPYQEAYKSACETMRETKRGRINKKGKYCKYKVSKKDRKDMLKIFVGGALIELYENR